MGEKNEIKGIQVNDVFGLEKPLTKLIESVNAGIGKVYEPIHIRRIAKAKKQEIEIIGNAVTNNIDLPTKYEDGKILIDATSADELLKRTSNRLLYKELRKQQNIESVIAETYGLLEREELVTAEPVNQDWLYKFFDLAGEIGDEYMQKLWSKILAGEIQSPNTYSLRTIDTLKNITQKEANLFNKLLQFIIFSEDEPVIYRNDELLSKYGITFEDLLILEDCRLIALDGLIVANFENKETIYNNDMILFINGKIELGIHTVTECGKQIINLVKEDIQPNDEYFLEFCHILKNKNRKLNFNVYKIKNISEKDSIENYINDKDLLN